ncbi:MAG: hypothetical protein ACYDEQ_10895 [Desulfocucumaceae bacterium]
MEKALSNKQYQMKGIKMKWLTSFIIALSVIALSVSTGFCQQSATAVKALEASVKANGHTIQLACEDFSMRNEGEYPFDLDIPGSKSTATLMSILPSGFKNPFNSDIPAVVLSFTKDFSKARVAKGQVVYVPTGVGANATGYKIFCIGAKNNIILTLTSAE